MKDLSGTTYITAYSPVMTRHNKTFCSTMVLMTSESLELANNTTGILKVYWW